ncbi:MAG: hypothetical protein EZS28_020995 [Streblomastix strix]|uniref:Uncharacterized protein n=1 Tax=Streblomastix strix TaxID=222440 RepID=A0A5J4VLF8_9EUKA|nr:MAG: hypothetical protein EZS28_020995 [Streblomastix strix]
MNKKSDEEQDKKKKMNFPFISIGDGSVGKRITVYEGFSQLSGSVLVEDVLLEEEDEDAKEAVKFDSDIEGGLNTIEECNKQVQFVHRFPQAIYQRGIIASLSFLSLKQKEQVNEDEIERKSEIGIIQNSTHILTIDVVDIDDEMEKIAKNFFGFPQSSNSSSLSSQSSSVRVHITDGIEYVKQLAIEQKIEEDNQKEIYHILKNSIKQMRIITERKYELLKSEQNLDENKDEEKKEDTIMGTKWLMDLIEQVQPIYQTQNELKEEDAENKQDKDEEGYDRGNKKKRRRRKK